MRIIFRMMLVGLTGDDAWLMGTSRPASAMTLLIGRH